MTLGFLENLKMTRKLYVQTFIGEFHLQHGILLFVFIALEHNEIEQRSMVNFKEIQEVGFRVVISSSDVELTKE